MSNQVSVEASSLRRSHFLAFSYNFCPLLGEGGAEVLTDSNKEEVSDANKSIEDGSSTNWDNNLTPAERRYMEERERIDSQKLAKTSNKSHRDRIEDFNQYLANMSEHYDIPKVGPG